MNRAVVYHGGPRHPFAVDVLAAQLAQAGFVCELHDDLDAAAVALTAAPTALFVVHALRWTMTQHEKYAEDRPHWGMTPSPMARTAITRYVRGGGGLFALHTSSICFDDWPEWGELLGGRWVWGRSRHPLYGTVAVSLDGTRISSSAVREALVKGELDRARALLGRGYTISGRVMHGDKFGRKLGFPTANVQIKHNHPPLYGIFAVLMGHKLHLV